MTYSWLKKLCSEAKSDHQRIRNVNSLWSKLVTFKTKLKREKARDQAKWEAHGWLQTDRVSEEVGKLNNQNSVF